MFISAISNVLTMGVLNTETDLKILKKNLQSSELFRNNFLEKCSIKTTMGTKLKYSTLIMIKSLEGSYDDPLICSPTWKFGDFYVTLS